MMRWSTSGWMMALCLVGAVACGDGGKGSGSASAKADTSAKASTSGTASAKQAAASGTPSAAPVADASAKPAGDKKEVNVDDLLKSNDPDASGVLNVDLSKVDEDAPALGGEEAEPPKPADESKQLEWLDAGKLEVPNPGWKFEKDDGMAFLLSPDEKGAVFFTTFDTQENGLKKVDAVVAALKLKNAKFNKPSAVKIGPKDDIPALVGGATAESKDGKPGRLFYALIKTGEPLNLLAIGGAPDEGGKEAFDTAINIIANIRRKGG